MSEDEKQHIIDLLENESTMILMNKAHYSHISDESKLEAVKFNRAIIEKLQG